MPNINTFKSSFDELSRNNRFKMDGNGCPPLPKLCIDIEVPAVSVATMEHRDGLHSAPFKIPYDAILAEATFTFRENIGFENRQYYEDWYKTIVTAKGFGYYDDFKRGPLNITQTRRDGADIKKWVLNDIYPIALSAIQFSNASQNEVTTWSVTLAYHEADFIG